ncbi:MAG: hypothetical protein HC906_07310 [Bacteroidales bacterium]|nr:hypothetical protein [Bacteroidales bacterium]
MKKYLVFFYLLLSLKIFTFAQDITIQYEIKPAINNTINSDIFLKVENGLPDYKAYIFYFNNPSWKGGKPITSTVLDNLGEGKFENIPEGKYYIIVEDAEKMHLLFRLQLKQKKNRVTLRNINL